jgi:hypothetical protein
MFYQEWRRINMGSRSLQETFDFVLNFIRKQGEPSIDRSFEVNCRYRLFPRNLKCGIGCLIPDEDYLPEMEGKNVFHNPVFSVLEKLGYMKIGDDSMIFLCQLQSAHDVPALTGLTGSEFVSNFNERMKVISEENDLVYNSA